LVAGSFQQRFLGGNTTDLYMFELVPLLFIGTIAWVVDRRGSVVGLALAGAATLWLVLTDSMHDKVAFSIINPSFNFQHGLIHGSWSLGHRLGIGTIDARLTLAVFALVLGAGAAVVRGRAPTRVALAAVTLPLLAYGVLATGYSMNKVTGALAGTPASAPHQLNWIDRAVGSGADVGLMLASNGTLINTWYTWWQPYFWNDSVQRAFVLPGGDPLAQGFVGTVTPDLATGRLLGLGGVRYLVRFHADTRFGLPALPVNPGAELTIVPTPTDRLLWGTRGVQDTGAVVWAAHPFVRVFDTARTPVTEAVTLVINLGGPVTGSRTVRLRSTVTISPSGHADLPLSLHGASAGAAPPAATLVAVNVSDVS
jgi:hypothetical protein